MVEIPIRGSEVLSFEVSLSSIGGWPEISDSAAEPTEAFTCFVISIFFLAFVFPFYKKLVFIKKLLPCNSLFHIGNKINKFVFNVSKNKNKVFSKAAFPLAWV